MWKTLKHKFPLVFALPEGLLYSIHLTGRVPLTPCMPLATVISSSLGRDTFARECWANGLLLLFSVAVFKMLLYCSQVNPPTALSKD